MEKTPLTRLRKGEYIEEKAGRDEPGTKQRGTTVPGWHDRATWHGVAVPPCWPVVPAGSRVSAFFRLFACFGPFSPLFAGNARFNLLSARINKTSKNLKEY